MLRTIQLMGLMSDEWTSGDDVNANGEDFKPPDISGGLGCSSRLWRRTKTNADVASPEALKLTTTVFKKASG